MPGLGLVRARVCQLTALAAEGIVTPRVRVRTPLPSRSPAGPCADRAIREPARQPTDRRLAAGHGRRRGAEAGGGEKVPQRVQCADRMMLTQLRPVVDDVRGRVLARYAQEGRLAQPNRITTIDLFDHRPAKQADRVGANLAALRGREIFEKRLAERGFQHSLEATAVRRALRLRCPASAGRAAERRDWPFRTAPTGHCSSAPCGSRCASVRRPRARPPVSASGRRRARKRPNDRRGGSRSCVAVRAQACSPPRFRWSVCAFQSFVAAVVADFLRLSRHPEASP